MGVLAISERGLKKVPADLRDVVIAAGKAGRKYVWDSNDVFIEKIRKAGLAVVVDIDVLPFIAKLAPLHDELAKEFGVEELLRINREEADDAPGAPASFGGPVPLRAPPVRQYPSTFRTE
jgi:TRAP-type C4-dicarboxylate transport system substrate-binding protein